MYYLLKGDRATACHEQFRPIIFAVRIQVHCNLQNLFATYVLKSPLAPLNLLYINGDTPGVFPSWKLAFKLSLMYQRSDGLSATLKVWQISVTLIYYMASLSQFDHAVSVPRWHPIHARSASLLGNVVKHYKGSHCTNCPTLHIHQRFEFYPPWAVLTHLVNKALLSTHRGRLGRAAQCNQSVISCWSKGKLHWAEWRVSSCPGIPYQQLFRKRSAFDSCLLPVCLQSFLEIYATFQIAYYFFLLLVHTAAALIKNVLSHAVCKLLRHTTSSKHCAWNLTLLLIYPLHRGLWVRLARKAGWFANVLWHTTSFSGILNSMVVWVLERTAYSKVVN